MKKVDLIIFDIDGTLIDSKRDIAEAINYTLKAMGFEEKDIDEIASYIGTGINDLIRKSLGENGDIHKEKALEVFKEYYISHSTAHSRLYPGVREILNYYKDKKKAIVTNRNLEFAVSGLKSFGIYEYFDDILGGDDLNCAKPNPCSLDRIINKLQIKKDRAIIVGDMDIDILAGKEAGIMTCAATYGIGRMDDIIKAKPDYTIDNITELKNIIK